MADNSKQTNPFPRHVAFIMDGNGRWAKQRSLPRIEGHKAGVKVALQLVEECVRLPMEVLTLFAFSSENWQRPQNEVNALMDLFLINLQKELPTFQEHNIRMRFIGDTQQFTTKLQQQIRHAQQQTINNTGLTLVVAANYGGRWDIIQAARQLAADVVRGKLSVEDINEGNFKAVLCLADLPAPDLFIRTSGEQRISNFLLWHLAYTEFYFTETLFPDFDMVHLQQALQFFRQRLRRFGRTSEQITSSPHE